MAETSMNTLIYKIYKIVESEYRFAPDGILRTRSSVYGAFEFDQQYVKIRERLLVKQALFFFFFLFRCLTKGIR